MTSQKVSGSHPPPQTSPSTHKPRPKWEILQVMNVVVVSVFVASLVYVAIHYRDSLNQPADISASPLTNIFFPALVLWSACLAYFFGFFGISFLDPNEIAQQAEAKHAASLHHLTNERGFEQSMLTYGAKMQAIQKKQGLTLQARHDTALCNETAAKPSPATEGVVIDYENATDDELFQHLLDGSLKDYELEKKLTDYERAVRVRRSLYQHLLNQELSSIPYQHYDYKKVFGANCEIVIGYVPLPLGVVGPLVLNGEPVYVPMATTEGCLVASTNRGCKAITAGGGCCSVVLRDAITRAPCVRLPSAMRAAAVKKFVSDPEHYAEIEQAFNSTTNYGRMAGLDATVSGRNVYLRFACMSGDAMGMNMVSKGCQKALDVLQGYFPDMEVVALSGNMCTDKKPAAINWILGRGKSIVVEAIIPDSVVKSVLKSSVPEMIETNRQKNLIGSAMAGSIGGFNAHAANIVTAVFLATGQDPAQNVESSNCLTNMELADDGKSLHVSVTMPSVEVGTVGGGTHLPAQAGCLDICGVRGAAKGPGSQPGDNSRKLAQIVGGAVLAGELSLMAALAANHLVSAHMTHNRKPAASCSSASSTVAAMVGQTDNHHHILETTQAMRRNASMPDMTLHEFHKLEKPNPEHHHARLV